MEFEQSIKNGNLTVDFEAECAYLTIKDETGQLFTVEHNSVTLVDYNARGEVCGYELLSLKHGFPTSELLEREHKLWATLEEANVALKEIKRNHTNSRKDTDVAIAHAHSIKDKMESRLENRK
jgi:uncharacterized protein YuzE